jgi:hypothetical protein
MKFFDKLFLLFALYFGSMIAPNNLVHAQGFEERRQQYFDSAAANPNDNAMVIEAYLNQPVTPEYLTSVYDEMETRGTIDFAIVQLIRVMFLGDGLYDTEMLPNLNLLPYWIYSGDTLHGYWSENHMIMWMGSDWLIHERTGRPIDASLEQRLRHYLQLKIDYGFYEFNSSVYAPYCFSGLINLADFAEDVEIKALATEASKLLLKEMLLSTTNQGVFYPSAGRNYSGKYQTPYGQNHSSLIYLLTGFGPAPDSPTHAGAFLATSSVDFTDVIDSWDEEVDTIIAVGHTLQEGFVINQELTETDRTIFQWSSGAYFHPDVVSSTVQLLADSNMWDHVDFALLAPLAGLPLEQYPTIANNLSAISKSSVICGQDVAIFKNRSVSLSSIQDFWKGKVGFQQWPIAACVGTTAVYTGSGAVAVDGEGTASGDNANEHLPYVEQSHNVALVMYRPEPVPELLPFNNKEVSLFWREGDFDEIVENGNWIIARQDESYIAVRRSCLEVVNGVRTCETPTDMGNGQTWVIIVGNDQMYGSFLNFQVIVGGAIFEEQWIMPTGNGIGNYYASITFDTIHADYDWQGDVGTSITENATENARLNVTPNPTSDIFMLVVPNSIEIAQLSIFNAMGQLVQRTDRIASGQVQVDSNHWPSGLYHIILDQGANRSYAKLVKE